MMNLQNDSLNFKAVLFDFSGTLYDDRNIVKSQQVVDYLMGMGIRTDSIMIEKLCRRLLDIADSEIGKQIRINSDISSQNHRAAWYKIAELVTGAPGGFAEAFYSCLIDTMNWYPFTDTEYVLKALKDMGVKICVVSNIGWDIRESFIKENLLRYIDSFVLSYEYNIAKPTKEIFKIACNSVQCNPSEVLMVGDNAMSDGGASACGIASYILPHISPNIHIRGLNSIVSLVGNKYKKNI